MSERARTEAKPKPPAPAPNKAVTKPTEAASGRAIADTKPSLEAPAPDVMAGLVITAEHLDDLEKMRVRFGNQIAAFERDYGWTPPHLEAQMKALHAQEHQVTLALQRLWRKHPLAEWQKSYLGLGEKSAARLIGIIGDPAERPNVSKLWQFCGHGDPAMSRPPKGASQAEVLRCGSPKAKKTVYLIAEAMLKAGNRVYYDSERERVKDHVHDKPCHRCGPAGKPAPAGSPWSDKHKHCSALRVSGKKFLLDLWVAARAQRSLDTHGSYGAGHTPYEPHATYARASQNRHDLQEPNGGAA